MGLGFLLPKENHFSKVLRVSASLMTPGEGSG